jgi:hypothetical protein
VNFEQEYTRSNGLIRIKGQPSNVPEVIDQNINMKLTDCTASVGYRSVRVDASPSLALYHWYVVAYIINIRAQNLAWQQCPAGNRYDNVNVSVYVGGQQVIHARSYPPVRGPSDPHKTNWEEFRNYAAVARINQYDKSFQENVQRRQQKVQQQARAAAGFKKDILGFKVGNLSTSIASIVSSSGCREVRATHDSRTIECPNGTIELTLTTHIQPQVIAAVTFRFCDLKLGEQVTLEVARQFGLSPVAFHWSGHAAYRLDETSTLTLNAILHSGCTMNGMSGYPYALVLRDQRIFQQNQQSIERVRQTSPTTRF